MDRILKTQLYRWDCPPAQRLGDYHLGLIGGAEERAIVRHLEQCSSCAAEIEELRVFLAAESEPAASVKAPSRRAGQRLGELIANLLPRSPGLALRGTDSGPIMAEADGTTIILDVQPAGEGHIAITGQVVADDQDRWTGALVEVRHGEALQATATVDDLGSFRAALLPAGASTLRITPEEGSAVVLAEVDLAE